MALASSPIGNPAGYASRSERLKLALTWLLLVCLIMEIGWEASSRYCFHRSLSDLTAKLQSEAHAGQKLHGAEAVKLMSGWPSSSQQDTVDGRRTEYRWHSLVWDLRIHLQSDASGAIEIVRIGSGLGPAVHSAEQALSRRRFRPPTDTDERPVRGMSATSPRAFALDVERDGLAPQSVERDRLISEVVRQSLTMVARDEGDFQTRDKALGDILPDDENATIPQINVVTSIDAQRWVLIQVERQHRDGAASLVAAPRFQLSPGPLIENLVARIDAMSTYELQTTLLQAGFDGRGHRFVARGPVPEAIANSLEEFDILSQLGAVRALHAEIRKKGESPERVAALARGYAHLAALCRFLWSPASKVFAARALLYAERMRRQAMGNSFAHWQRGYVRALVGLRATALEDFAVARADSREPSAPPDWGTVAEAYCQGDMDQLAKLSDRLEYNWLAQYLWLQALTPSAELAERNHAAALLMGSQHNCELVFDLLIDNAPIGIDLELAVHAREVFSARLRDFLRSYEDIPDEIRKLADGPAGSLESGLSFQAQAAAALRKAGTLENDGGEPSFAVLAQLIQDISFAQMCRMLSHDRLPRIFVPTSLGMPVAASGQM